MGPGGRPTPPLRHSAAMPTRSGISAIKNKDKRKQVLAREKLAKSTARKREREAAAAEEEGGAAGSRVGKVK